MEVRNVNLVGCTRLWLWLMMRQAPGLKNTNRRTARSNIVT